MDQFNGFSSETLNFLSDLRDNNNRTWFEENKSTYQDYVLRDAQHFVMDMGKKLATIAPDIVAIPKVDKSIFRIYRDTRFSKNKLPYKSNIAVFFWEGDGKKLENPGFYLHMDPDKYFIGVGLHEFPKSMIDTYRNAVIDSRHGSALQDVIDRVKKRGKYQLGWKKYKKVPRGFDAGHERAEYLLFGGIGFHLEEPVTSRVQQADFADDCFDKFKDMADIHDWLKNIR